MTGLDFAAFERRLAAMARPQMTVRHVPADDGVSLAYALFLPEGEFRDLLVFYHGGGANMRAGYDRMAAALAACAPVAVCLADLRGHGESGGPRGHVARPEIVWCDVDALLLHLASAFPKARLLIGGHSSGAGMVLNYLTRHRRRARPERVVMLAPALGNKARLEARAVQAARVAGWPFVVNAMSGGSLLGDWRAVRFTDGASAEAGLLGSHTVNMARAVTPEHATQQMARLQLPCWVGIAELDELIDPRKLTAFLEGHAAEAEVLANATHLSVILDAAPAIGRAAAAG
jgi:alpha-beta hydrolase superfamily lysophospholipase